MPWRPTHIKVVADRDIPQITIHDQIRNFLAFQNLNIVR